MIPSRRDFLLGLAAALPAALSCRSRGSLPLGEFVPRSMLRVPETPEAEIARARFAAIDFHSHLSWSAAGLGAEPYGERMRSLAPVSSLLEVMDRRNIQTMVNLTGGVGQGLDSILAAFDRAHPGRFLTFTEPSWNAFTRPDFPAFQAEQIEKRTGWERKG